MYLAVAYLLEVHDLLPSPYISPLQLAIQSRQVNINSQTGLNLGLLNDQQSSNQQRGQIKYSESMWKSFLDRKEKPDESSSSRRKDESRSKRKDSGNETVENKTYTESMASSSTRKASRGDDRGIDPVSTSYSSSSKGPRAGATASSAASSYQTAQPVSYGEPDKSVTSRGPNSTEDNHRSRGVVDEKTSRRAERSTSRNRKGSRRNRSRSEERIKDDKKEKKLKRRSTDNGMYSGESCRAQPLRAIDSSSRAGPPTISNHVPDMFPGQFTSDVSAPYRPPLSVTEGGPGLASEYYNDVGQSVTQQSVIRQDRPNAIVGIQPHPMTASSSVAPHAELGATASFYGPSPIQSSNFNSVPNLSSSQSTAYASGSNNTVSAAGVAAAGAMAGYMMSQHNEPSASYQANAQHGRPMAAADLSEFNSNSRPQQPGKQSSSTNIPYIAAAGAVGLAAGAYHDHHNSNQSGNATGNTYSSGGNNVGMTHQHRHSGPFHRIVDFFKDPEGVARFEEYSEISGICRNCFEPGTTSSQAPRRHNFKVRRSSDKKRSSRVDKENRYSSSSDSGSRGQSKKAVLVAAAAGLGLAAVGRTLNGDFDDTYSVKSGKYRNSESAPRRLSPSYQQESYPTRDEKKKKSEKKVEYGNSSDGGLYKNSKPSNNSQGNIITVEQGRSRSDSNKDPKLRDTAIGAATGITAIAAIKRRKSVEEIRIKHRSRSGNSERYSRRRQSPVQSPSLFGRFFSPISSNQRKKNKGFFNFSNGSSSSENSDRDYSRKTKRSSPKIRSVAEANAALVGLGTATAALAVHENRNRKASKQVVSVKSKTRPHRNHNSKQPYIGAEDGWESASEYSVSSADSDLAFGSPFGRSRESLAETGTDKWDWRWGQKKRRSSSPKLGHPRRDTDLISAAASGVVGVVAGNLMYDTLNSRHADDVHNHSSSGLTTSRHVDPIAASHEPSKRQEYYRAHSEPMLIQQPQPIAPVPNAVYQRGDSDGIAIIQPKSLRNKEDGVRFDFTKEQEGQNNYKDYRNDEPERGRQLGESTFKPSRSSRSDNADFVIIEPGKPRSNTDSKEIHHTELDADQFAEIQAQLARLRILRDPDSQQTSKAKGRAGFVLAGMAAAAVAVEAKKKRTEDSVAAQHQDSNSNSKKTRPAEGLADFVSAVVSTRDQTTSQKKTISKDTSQEDERSIERVIANKAAAKVRKIKATTPVAHESYASYFAPDILSDRSKTKETNSNSNADVDFISSNGNPAAHTRGGMPEPEFPKIENEQFELHTSLPWGVPRLGLINPTPPISRAGSRNASALPSPMLEPLEPSIAEEDESEPIRDVKLDKSQKPIFTVIAPRNTNVGIVNAGDEVSNLSKLDEPDSQDFYNSAESPIEEVKRTTMPGVFEDDIDFAATLAAGTAAAGFDPEIVIENPTYRRRDSPPDSQLQGFYRQPQSQTVSDVALEAFTYQSMSSQRGFVEGEIPDTPKEDAAKENNALKKESVSTREQQPKPEERNESSNKQKHAAGTEHASNQIEDHPVKDNGKNSPMEADTPVFKKGKNQSKRSAGSGFASIAFAAAGEVTAPKTTEDFTEANPKLKGKGSKKSGGFDLASIALAAATTDVSEPRAKEPTSEPDAKPSNKSSTHETDIAPNVASPRDDTEPSITSAREIKDGSQEQEDEDTDDPFDSPSEYAPSAYTAPVGSYDDENDENSRKHKRKSKRRSKNFDDAASIASMPTKMDDSLGSSKSKEKRGGLFGRFGKSSPIESDDKRQLKEISAQATEQLEESKKKKKKSKKSREGDDFYSIASTSVGDVSKPDDDEETRRPRRRRSRKDTNDDDLETDFGTLPHKVC